MGMFGYYLEIAVRSLRRSTGLTLLMVLAIGFGVGASMTTYAVFRAVSGDPIPWKSSSLFVPQVDTWGPAGRADDGEPQDALDYIDAMALMRDHRAARQSTIYAVAPSVLPTDASRTPIPLNGFAVYGEFFPMLDVPFEYGSGWSADADSRGAPVVVIGDTINRRLFGGVDSIGRTVSIGGRDYRVVGVMKPWNPQPIFFDVVDTGGFGGDGPDLFLPFQAAIGANMENAGATNCPKGRMPSAQGFAGLQSSACTWIAYMVELDGAAAVQRYRLYRDDYAREHQRLGRFDWAPNNRLRDLQAWLNHEHVVPDDTKVSMLVALGLLLVCLLNTVGLLLTKFLRRSGEIGVRRALGASRSAICMQFLAEAAVIGVAGGILGLLLTGVGVLATGQVLPMYLVGLAHVDVSLLLLTVLVAVLATVLAGLYPAMRASRVQPAWQLKTQ